MSLNKNTYISREFLFSSKQVSWKSSKEKEMQTINVATPHSDRLYNLNPSWNFLIVISSKETR